MPNTSMQMLVAASPTLPFVRRCSTKTAIDIAGASHGRLPLLQQRGTAEYGHHEGNTWRTDRPIEVTSRIPAIAGLSSLRTTALLRIIPRVYIKLEKLELLPNDSEAAVSRSG